MLVIAFDSSTWIITIPLMGVSQIVGSIVGNMGLVGEQNVMNHMGVRIQGQNSNQLTHVGTFKMLNALDMV
jgi:hypothetical protein